ncbi:MAG: hypothetical protein II382_00290 [Oscillospiraceae bacterium]|nr:hypothetical protein [Oscillospiraceae bacterium]
MKQQNRKQILKKLCAMLLFAALFVSLAAGCANREQTQNAAPQTTAPAETIGPTETTGSAETNEPVETAEPEDASCDALFYGDSITKGNNFDEFFPQLRIVDFGINGATIQDLTARVDEVNAHHPAKIFVQAGGNNLDSHNIDECIELFRGLLDALTETCPYAEVYVESMLPLNKSVAASWDCSNKTIRTYNKQLAELAAEYGMIYLDTHAAYEYHGELNPEMTEDGAHLKYECFGPWAEVVRPYLEP